MKLSSHSIPPSAEELESLVRLLDDDTPAVRAKLAERFALCSGDLSEWLASRNRSLSRRERAVLSQLLAPARRATLEREWQMPGEHALAEDWESFEGLLRLISDFLHDGLTVRQSLSDALDLLAEEADESGVASADELRIFLFENSRLRGNRENLSDARNSDLAWAIAEGKSHSLGLGIVFLLVAKRLDFVVEGVNFPERFLCRIYEDGYPLIVDCFENGCLYAQADLLDNPKLTREERVFFYQAANPGEILRRLLRYLVQAFNDAGRKEDKLLIRKLQAAFK